MAEIMTPDHPEWEVFLKLLFDSLAGFPPRCSGSRNKEFSRSILENHFHSIDIPQSLAFFEDYGGYCDCEVLLNVSHC